MGASNTPLYDLIELSGLSQNTTYTTATGGGGDILGFVDNATYTDGETGNSSSQIGELNETADADSGTLMIDGVTYTITLADPDNTNVTVTYNNGGSSSNISGDSITSNIAFIQATPSGGGTTRYFAVIDDDMGDFPDITSIQIRSLDYSPSGNDIKIDADQDNNVTVCFAANTLIDTPKGARKIEQISAGDLVHTLDHGPQPVIWAHTWRQPLDNDMRSRKNAPVRIARGALGAGLPDRDVIVSPQHRILIGSKVTERMFGAREILVPAKKLVGMRGITREKGLSYMRYTHLLLESHEVLLTQGIGAESLLSDARGLEVLGTRARCDIRTLAPPMMVPARPIVENGAQLRELLRRHKKNRKPLVMPRALHKAATPHANPAVYLAATG
ncbi:MAG: Hint domain-containing protein [Maritimibacter sp.]